MLIINTKTNTTFSGYTVADREGYAAVVTRRVGNNEALISRVVYPTRSKAYYNAMKLCKTYATNHAFIN